MEKWKNENLESVRKQISEGRWRWRNENLEMEEGKNEIWGNENLESDRDLRSKRKNVAGESHEKLRRVEASNVDSEWIKECLIATLFCVEAKLETLVSDMHKEGVGI
ncbi:hypothetical protein U1Q18_041929 [Sarracenia purpurea var. burkii]